MPRLCECGCGESLRPGAVRPYKNGHNPNSRHKNSPKVDREPVGETPDLTEQQPTAHRLSRERIDIDYAAGVTPDDPDPGHYQPPDPATKTPVDAKTQADVRAKVMFWFEIFLMPVQALDPYCGKAFQDNLPNITKKLTPVLCQSPEVVKWFTKSGNFAMWADLAMACWPVIQMIIAHHIAKTIGKEQRGQPLKDYNPHMYSTDV